MQGQSRYLDDGDPLRAIHFLARSISRELLNQGFEARHLIDLAGELLDVACDSFRAQRAERRDLDDAAERRPVELAPDVHAPATPATSSPWWRRQWEQPPARPGGGEAAAQPRA